ncbi:hypothetical protein, partial [Candidatus Cardinium sp. cBcalN1]|uniref:hypothetical protein n=1 Tax=Candidatus Cardinium sp. cBcalN1 TaxID=2699437 RepID=UPI001FB2E2E9
HSRKKGEERKKEKKRETRIGLMLQKNFVVKSSILVTLMQYLNICVCVCIFNFHYRFQSVINSGCFRLRESFMMISPSGQLSGLA